MKTSGVDEVRCVSEGWCVSSLTLQMTENRCLQLLLVSGHGCKVFGVGATIFFVVCVLYFN